MPPRLMKKKMKGHLEKLKVGVGPFSDSFVRVIQGTHYVIIIGLFTRLKRYWVY